MPRKARQAPSGAQTLQALREAVFGSGASLDGAASLGTGAIMTSSFPMESSWFGDARIGPGSPARRRRAFRCTSFHTGDFTER